MKNCIAIFIIIFAICGCNTHQIEVFQGERYLFFPDSAKGLDTTYFSFSHYTRSTTHDVSFLIMLTGALPDADLEFELAVVDSLTTADPRDYELPTNLKFPVGQTSDYVTITLNNARPELESKKVSVVFRIVENKNFKPGLSGLHTVKVSFDNIKSKPLWWTGNVERILLGEYSELKFEHFVIATGVSDLTDVSLSEVRSLVIKFKLYLVENNIMDDDGVTPMVDNVPGT